MYLSVFMVSFLGRKKRELRPPCPLKYPQIMAEAGCLTVFTMYLERYRLTVEDHYILPVLLSP